MGAAAAAIGPIIGLASTGFKIAGDLQQGQSQADADMFKAQQLQTEAAYGQIKADQTSMTLQRQLQTVLGSIQAVRASANVDPNSPTGAALVQRSQALGDQQRQIAVDNIQAQVREDQAGVAFEQNAAQSAISGSWLGAAGDALSGLSGLAKGFNTGGPLQLH